MMGIITVRAGYLAQRLKVQQLEDVGTTISDGAGFHLPIRDGASREPLPVEVIAAA